MIYSSILFCFGEVTSLNVHVAPIYVCGVDTGVPWCASATQVIEKGPKLVFAQHVKGRVDGGHADSLVEVLDLCDKDVFP